MLKTLKIEIETEDDERIISLLEHVFNEIKSNGQHKNCFIENNYYVEDGWLIVKDGPYKGKYNWSKS